MHSLSPRVMSPSPSSAEKTVADLATISHIPLSTFSVHAGLLIGYGPSSNFLHFETLDLVVLSDSPRLCA